MQKYKAHLFGDHSDWTNAFCPNNDRHKV